MGQMGLFEKEHFDTESGRVERAKIKELMGLTPNPNTIADLEKYLPPLFCL